MKPEELRIGNLVIRYSNIMKVYGVGNERADLILIQPNTMVNWCMLYQDISPMPITSEWLDKFGFHSQTHRLVKGVSYSKDGISYYTNDNAIKLYGNYMYNIKYIHQLQNLYFLVNGKELEVKSEG
jgi:hypothetical protein